MSASTITGRRLIDLIPTQYTMFLLVLLAGGAIISGLETLYYWMPQLVAHTSDGSVAAFDLDAEGSLATWFSTITLFLASLTALLVYWVRGHREDDYHGRYRIWLWAALTWLLMSIDEASSLHEGFKELMVLATGTRLYGDGSLWWVMPYAVLLSFVGVRLLLDMRPAKLAIAALVAAGLCYVGAVLAQLELLIGDALARAIMLEEGLEMSGHLLVWLSMGLAGRHMVLDAQGLLPERKARRPKRRDTETEDEARAARPPKRRREKRSATLHSAHTSTPSRSEERRASKAVAKKPANASRAAEDEYEDEEDVDPQPRRKLSRAERKARRRQARQDRQADYE